MKKYTITEQDLYSLFKFTFVAGEHYEKDWALKQIGEVEEITEPDFDEWFKLIEVGLKEFENK